MALAGGVSINVDLLRGYRYQDGGIMSPDGHCRVFDANARGTVFGSGVGVVVLKRLEDAMQDGDEIHAVVKGSAVNNDGGMKAGYTTPSVEGQAEVVAEAMASAGVDPESIGYIECHGTGTLLGDPVEVRALTKAFRASTGRRHFCTLGSVKSSIGHLDAAAGVAGLIKTVLSLKHGMLMPSVQFHEPNPQIEFDDSPFYVNTEGRPWRTEGGPRRAGVSAFGVGGTNVHVVLEEGTRREKSGEGCSPHVLMLSARTESALTQMMKNLALHLRENPDIEMADVAYTLQMGRRQFAYRWTGLCRDRAEAIALLEGESGIQGVAATGKESHRICLLFPGESTVSKNMGRELYAREPLFRQAMNHCRKIVKSRLGADLRFGFCRKRLPSGEWRRIAQPALLAVEWSLAQLWRSWGLEDLPMIGYGVGEYTVACLAGVITLEDALIMAELRECLQPESGFAEVVETLALKRPLIRYISSMTGTWIQDEEAQDPNYWVAHLRSPVHFARGLSVLSATGNCILLQVGPGENLRALIEENGLAASVVASMPEAPADSEIACLAAAAGRLWCAGLDLNWAGLHAGIRRQRVALPTYPFERKRYWIEPVTLPASPSQEHLAAAATPEQVVNYSPRPVLRNSYVSPEDEAERKAVAILETALGIRPVGVTDRYGELGGDSLTAVRVIDQLNVAFQANLRVVDLYEGLTIRDLLHLVTNEASVVAGDNDEENSGGNDKRRLYQHRRQSHRQPDPV